MTNQEKNHKYSTQIPIEYTEFQDRVKSVKAEIEAYNNLPIIIKDASPPKSPQSLEEKLMENCIQELKSQGDRRAKGQVGDPTTLETDKWCIILTNQGEIGRVVVSSYIRPGSFKWPNKKSVFSLVEIESIEGAIKNPSFNSNENFKATKELFKYQHRFSPVTPNEPFSPVQLCIEELKARMTPT